MKTVFVVFQSVPYEGGWIDGIFEKREDAELYARGLSKGSFADTDIQEWPLDGGIRISQEFINLP